MSVTVPSAAGDLSWVAVLEHHAARHPDRPAIHDRDRAVTYGELADWSARLAGGLAERGVGPGDVVGLLSYNSAEFLAAIYAANSVGAAAMPVNWRLAGPELRYVLEHSGARAFLCDADLLDLGRAASDGLDQPLARIVVPDRCV